MEIDDIFRKHVGQFGRFQAFMLTFISIETIFTAFHTMGSVFLVGTPKHHCQFNTLNLTNKTGEDLLHFYIPSDEQNKLSSCEMYDRNYTVYNESWHINEHILNNVSKEHSSLSKKKCEKWIYDDTIFKYTMVTEWDLVCDQKYLAFSVATVFMAARIIGCLIFGPLADWIGRKPVALVAGFIQLVCGVAMALVPNITGVLILRFILSCCITGKTTASFILTNEFVGPDWRVFATMVYSLYWVFGYILIAGIAYLIPNWRTLQLVISTPEVIFLILFIFIVPESPRWLMTKNRNKEAKAIVCKMARINKTECPKDMDIANSAKLKMGTFLDLIRTPGLRKVTIIIWLGWFSCGFVYYGLSLNTSDLGGNPYLNFMISGAVEVPAYIVMVPLLKVFGRIYPYVAFSVIVGISLVSIMPIPPNYFWLTVTVSMIGKFAISCAFLIIWFYCIEVYPTEIRSIGINSASILARIGSVLATYVGLLASIHDSLHFAVFGVCAVLSAILAVGLPETLGAPLTQKIPQAEAFIQNDPGKLCFKRKRHHKEAKEMKENMQPLKCEEKSDKQMNADC